MAEYEDLLSKSETSGSVGGLERASGGSPRHRFLRKSDDRICLPAVDEAVPVRLDSADTEWDHAIARAPSTVSGRPVVDHLIQLCDVLPHYWWTFVQNDPYYRNDDLRPRRTPKGLRAGPCGR